MNEREQERISTEFTFSTVPVGDRAFALRIEEDDMSPDLVPGDFIVVDPDQALESGDLGIVKIAGEGGDQVLLRKIVFEDDGSTRLIALNPRYPELVARVEEARKIIGKVVETRNSL